jgi:hypothetical protein
LWRLAIGHPTEQGCEGPMDQLTTEDIKNLASLADIAKSVDPTAAKIVGSALSFFGAAIAILTHINNLRTKKNTEANKATVAILSEHERKMEAHEEKMTKLKREAVSEFENKINFANNQFMSEVDKFKIVMVKIHRDTDQKLEQIPKMQDRLTKVEKQAVDTDFRVDRNKEELDQFYAWMKEQIRRRQGGGT